MTIGALLAAFSLGKSSTITFIASLWLFANFFVTKQIELFSFHVTASDVYTVGAMYGMSLLQERYGKEAAFDAIYAGFLLLITGALFSHLHLFYMPSSHDHTEQAFSLLLSSTPRLALASITTFFISSQLDVHIFQLLKKGPLSFPIRTVITLFFVMAFDTALFTLLGLYGMMNNLWDIFIVSFAIKLMTAALTSPFLCCIEWIIPKRIEK